MPNKNKPKKMEIPKEPIPSRLVPRQDWFDRRPYEVRVTERLLDRDCVRGYEPTPEYHEALAHGIRPEALPGDMDEARQIRRELERER